VRHEVVRPNIRRPLRVATVGLLLLGTAAGARPIDAQASIPNIRGMWGLRSGTLLPPGAYLGPLYYRYSPNKIIDKDGNSIDRARIQQRMTGLFGMYSSPRPVVGAHWAMWAAVPWANFAIETPNIDRGTSWGFSDVYVQPIDLGWSFSRADLITGFGFYAPSGRFEPGANDNTGLGMWSYAFNLGTTVYADSAKHWNAATLATFQTNSHVRGTDRRAGNVLTLQGGAGYAFLQNAAVAGLSYYAQWKVSDDRNFLITRIPRFDARDRYYGLGPELTTPLPFRQVPMVLTLRYFFETGNRVATQGNAFFAILTLVKPMLPSSSGPHPR
jgi:hypothetical protein